MFSGEPRYFELPAPKAEFQKVSIDVRAAVKDPKAVKAIRIGMNPLDAKLMFEIRKLEFLRSVKTGARTDVSEALKAAAPGSVFLAGEALAFELSATAPEASGWKLLNWKDQTLREGAWPAERGRSLVLDPLPNGYYKLKLSSEEGSFEGFRSFAILADPASLKLNPDSFFALDSAQSWLANADAGNKLHPGNGFETTSEVVRRAGAGMVRERMSWGEVEAKEGVFKWARYKENADLLAARGVRTLGMYHDAPAWAKDGNAQLPGDLLAAYRFAREAAGAMRGRMAAWEFWNEQDIAFAPEAAWDYASALKAAYLGFKAADPEMPVAIGGYCGVPPMPYADLVMENGAAEYFDIFNVHYYQPVRELPEICARIRAHMKQFGIEGRPLWITENGCRADGAARAPSFMPGMKAHSPEQEMIVAEYIPKIMIGLQAEGVARDFLFVLPPYNEHSGNKDWGLMRRDYTVKPGYVAFATLSAQLGAAELEGEYKAADGVKAYLYRCPDGSQTLVCWSLSEIDLEDNRPNLDASDLREKRFQLPQTGEIKGVDLFGSPFKADASKALATRYPVFLTGLSGLRPSKLLPKSLNQAVEPSGYDKTIVFRVKLTPDFELANEKDHVKIRKENLPFKLLVYNFSDREKRGVISISGAAAAGLPEKASIPAFGVAEFDLTLLKLDRKFQSAMVVSGVFEGKKATPLRMPVQNTAQMTAESRQTAMPSMVDPANWRSNSSGKMEISYDEAAKAVRFRTVFPAGVDRWTYPEYSLQLPQESLKGAVGIGFEAKVSSAPGVAQMLVMAVRQEAKEGGRTVYLKVDAPKESWEERFAPIHPSLDPEQVKTLRIGLNSNVDDISCWIRNVRIFYAR
jgi:hypothetical protein